MHDTPKCTNGDNQVFYHIFTSILSANFLHLLFKGTVSQFAALCLVVLVLPLKCIFSET